MEAELEVVKEDVEIPGSLASMPSAPSAPATPLRPQAPVRRSLPGLQLHAMPEAEVHDDSPRSPRSFTSDLDDKDGRQASKDNTVYDAVQPMTPTLSNASAIGESNGMRSGPRNSRFGLESLDENQVSSVMPADSVASEDATSAVTSRLSRRSFGGTSLRQSVENVGKRLSEIRKLRSSMQSAGPLGSMTHRFEETNDLGVAFCTRAEVGATVCARDSRLQNLSEKLEYSLPKFFTDMIPSGSVTSQISWILRISGIFSCAFVTALFSVEPPCMRISQDSLNQRLQDPDRQGFSVLSIIHVANAIVYLLLSIVHHAQLSSQKCSSAGLYDIAPNTSKKCRVRCVWLDVLASIGFAAEVVHLVETGTDVPTFSQWVCLLQLLKSWRLAIPVDPVETNSDTFLQAFLRLFAKVFFFVHGVAMLLMVIANFERQAGGASWLDSLLEHDDSCGFLYTEALYFSTLSVTSVGYGDILVTSLERGVNTIILLFANLFMAKVCADLTWLTSMHNYWESETQSRQAQTAMALHQLQAPVPLRERVLAYQSFLANVHREEDLNQPAFKGLSSNLNRELRLCAYRKLILKAPFLRDQAKDVIAMMVGTLEDLVYLPADFIVCSGDQGRELFFMRHGEAGVFACGSDPPIWGETPEVSSYTQGNYFGEVGMLTGKRRSAWIMAKTYCVLSVLPYTTVEVLKEDHPEAFTTLVQSMVRAFNLTSSTTWDTIMRRWKKKYAKETQTSEDAFKWFCEQGDDDLHDLMENSEECSAKAFENALRLLKVSETDRMILWADLDADNSGRISYAEFLEKADIVSDLSPSFTKKSPFQRNFSVVSTMSVASTSQPFGSGDEDTRMASLRLLETLQNQRRSDQDGHGQVLQQITSTLSMISEELQSVKSMVHASKGQTK
eukprot:TRINITY_DN37273_c0_g1_i1.p1 TRINITY_DN37273_c0_g1~~TRINITY_DN37273_c0_g1_i1.p1  ORF type:complete len:899 (+),score=132.25 TRINITY_DN37273_c0_g1_i1:149-2845(+)